MMGFLNGSTQTPNNSKSKGIGDKTLLEFWSERSLKSEFLVYECFE